MPRMVGSRTKSKKCVICGTEFFRVDMLHLSLDAWNRRRTCSTPCATKARNVKRKREGLEGKKRRKKIEPVVDNRDIKQRQIDDALRDKESLVLTSRTIKPGDPEFNAIASLYK